MSAGATDLIAGDDEPRVRGFRLEVIEGPAAGAVWARDQARCTIGSAASNDLAIEDSTVSRFHCEVEGGESGVRVRDLGSKNATSVDGVTIQEARLRHGSLIRCGRTVLRFELADRTVAIPLSERTRFGSLVGRSPAMRAAFAVLERAAGSDVTVLIEGETGTGKEGAARALHEAGRRGPAPLHVIDCGSIPATLIEAELFGHERGAFTGAAERRVGAFEAAQGGTVFLDEIGELPLELQPKLLRVLEAREVRRVGAATPTPLDVRVIAATHRDLRAEVNSGGFRADLYYRLAVVRVELPPLRRRPEDLPLLVEAILGDLGRAGRVPPEVALELQGSEFVASLGRAAWPGNVRELRNFLEQCAVLGAASAPGSIDPPRTAAPAPIDLGLPYKEARQRVLDDFERRYLEGLLAVHGDNVSAAARAAGISRMSLYALIKRHGER